MRKFLSAFVILLLGSAALGLALTTRLLDDQPVIARMAPPGPEDIRATRAFYNQVRLATNDAPDAPETVQLDIATLQGMLRMGAPLLPEYRAEAQLGDDRVYLRAALPVPLTRQGRWLNLDATIAPFEGRFAFDTVTLGGRSLPPALARHIAYLGAELTLGRGMGARALDLTRSMTIAGDEMIIALRLDRAGRSEMAQDVFSALRGAQMPAPELVEAYYITLRNALEEGRLAPDPDNSFVPLLQVMLTRAHAQSDASSAANELAAALLALGRACGAIDFGLIFGPLVGRQSDELGRWQTSCAHLVLAGRVDLKRHFITAACLKAASTRSFAISIGEFKELNDIISANGFDFTDITANNSGIRLASLFLNTPHADWPDLIARITHDTDILPALDGIPGAMSQDAFLARFGSIDSPTYLEMLALIEARIDALPLHRAPLDAKEQGG